MCSLGLGKPLKLTPETFTLDRLLIQSIYYTQKYFLYIYIDIEKLTNGHGKRTYFLVNTIKWMRWISSQPSCECTEEFNPNTQKFGWYSYRHMKFTTKCLGGGNSNIFYVHPQLGKMNPFWLIFFKWVVSTTNQMPIGSPVSGKTDDKFQNLPNAKPETEGPRCDMRGDWWRASQRKLKESWKTAELGVLV